MNEIEFPEGSARDNLVTLRSPGQAVTLKRRETIVREGWPSAFRAATERVWLHLGVEVDRHLQQLPSGQRVSKISYSWSEIERYPTHAVWEALAIIDTLDQVENAPRQGLATIESPGMVE